MDAFEQWFAILREQGEILDVKAAHFAARDAEPRRWLFPHERYDGARMFEQIMRELGNPPPVLPKIRELGPPSLFQRLRALWREVTDPPRAPVPWRYFDRDARSSLETHVAHTLFEREETATIVARAESNGARANAFLLWALDAAVYPALADPSSSHRWAVPVNMRGALGKLEALANVAAFVAVDVGAADSPAQVRRAIKSRLEQNAHWGSWYAFRLLGYLGASYMRHYAAKYYARPGHSWVGTFTNVGPYTEDAGWVYLLPPVTRTHPVGACAATVGGRLSLSLHTHPVLGPTDVEAMLARWKALVEGAVVRE